MSGIGLYWCIVECLYENNGYLDLDQINLLAYELRVEKKLIEDLIDNYDLFKKNNYYTRKYFYPLTCDQVCFKNKYNTHDLSNAKKLASTVLILPLYENLQLNRLREITEIIKCSLDAL